MNYQQNQRLAQSMAQFQPVQNGGLAGALAQGLAGFGSGYFGGQAINQQQQMSKTLADSLAKGDSAGFLKTAIESGDPALQGLAYKTQMEQMQEAAKQKRLGEMLGIQNFATTVGSTPGAGAGVAPPPAGGKTFNDLSPQDLALISTQFPEAKPFLDIKLQEGKDAKEEKKRAEDLTRDKEKTGDTNATKFMDDFRNDSKEFVKSRDAFVRIRESAKDPSPAGDIALIFNYMKLLDPGSVVREGEFATAQNAGSIPDNVRSMYNKALSGERLIPEIRTDFVNRASLLYNGMAKQHKSLVSQYEGIAKQYGVDPKKIIIDYGVFNDDAGGGDTPTPEGVPEGAKKAPDGNYYIPDPQRPGKYLLVE